MTSASLSPTKAGGTGIYRQSATSSAFSQFSHNSVGPDDNRRESPEHVGNGIATSTTASVSSASHCAPETPDRGQNANYSSYPQLNKPVEEPAERTVLHYRTNFGKERGYMPPETKSNPIRQPPPVEFRRPEEAIPPTRRPFHQETPDDESEMPFDVQNDIVGTSPPRTRSQKQTTYHHEEEPKQLPLIPQSRTQRSIQVVSSPSYTVPDPSDWENSRQRNRHSPLLNEMDPNEGHFSLSPPRASDPTNFEFLEQDGTRRLDDPILDSAIRMRDAATDGIHYVEERGELSDYEEFGFSPRSTTTTETNLDCLSRTANSMPNLVEEPQQIPQDEDSQIPQDEDSLFDFQEEESATKKSAAAAATNRKSALKYRRKTRSSSPLDDCDDTSCEDNYGAKPQSPANLQQRTAQAWEIRRAHSNPKAKSAPIKSTSVPTKSTSVPTKSISAPKSPAKTPVKVGVSFRAEDTVHTFERDEVEVEDDDAYCSFDDRSMESEYTKTMESEVEDLVKDILFIGDPLKIRPGHRKVKDKPGLKPRGQRQRQYQEDDDDDDDDDDETPEERTVEAHDDVAAVSKFRVNMQRRESTAEDQSISDEEGTLESSPVVSQENEDDDPLLAMWNVMESGLNAMTSALGLGFPSDQKVGATSKENPPSKENIIYSNSNRGRSAKRATSAEKDCGNDLVPFGGERCSTRSDGNAADNAKGLQEFVHYAQHMIYGSSSSAEESMGESMQSAVSRDHVPKSSRFVRWSSFH
jgi:hypothetical protein